MKYVKLRVNIPRFFLLFFAGIVLVPQAYGSAIMGTIYDQRRNPLAEVNVELLNDYYQVINRAYTDGTGRYEFNGLIDGRYTVKVLPFKHDLLEQTQLIEIYTSTVRGAGGGNTLEVRDFYLLPRKGSLEEAEASVVFVQEIPKDAKRAYEDAIDLFPKRRRVEGLKGLRDAINLFPNYFLALNRLGQELIADGKYGEAFPLLMKATDVNPKSPKSFYYLGLALHQLKYYPAAIVALNQAHLMSPNSVPVLWTLGAAERQDKKLNDAEKHLLQAKKLSKTVSPDLIFELALVYRDQARYGDAADELEAFLKARSDAKDIEKIRKLIAEYRKKQTS